MNAPLELKNPFTEGKVISKDTDPKVYHRNGERGTPDFVMSRTDLMEFYRCPARWIKGYKHKQTEDMEWGQLLDATTLAPESFDKLYAVTPETYPAEPKKKGDPIEDKPWNWNANVCKAWRDDVLKRGQIPVHHEDYKGILAAKEILSTNAAIMELIQNADRQVMVMARYQDPATAIRITVKIMIDICPWLTSKWHMALADLKTGGSADPDKWAIHVCDFDLDAQAALYLDVYTAATGEDRNTFLHPMQENYEPYHSELHMLDAEYIGIGRMKYQAALKLYAQCLKTNEWPGYTGDKIAGCTIIRPSARALRKL